MRQFGMIHFMYMLIHERHFARQINNHNYFGSCSVTKHNKTHFVSATVKIIFSKFKKIFWSVKSD